MIGARTATSKYLSNIPAWIWIAAILCLGLCTRLLGLRAESAWIDEGYSIALAKYTVPEIIAGTAADQHPPLYYLLLHFWLFLGSGVLHARLLSVFFGVINIYQVLILGRKMGGLRIGILGGLLVSLNPMHIWYSQEARQYMLLVVLTTAATHELWVSLHGKHRWFTYGLFSLLSLYTQYFAVFILFAHAVIVCVWVVWQRNRKILWRWILTMSGVGLFFLPWLPVAIDQFRFHQMPWIGDPAAGDILDIPLRLILGSGILLLPEWLRWLGWLVLLGVFTWALGYIRKSDPDSNHIFGFLAIWGLAPYLVISVVSILYPVFQFKQFLILLIPMLLLATVIASILPRTYHIIIVTGLVLVVSATSIYQQMTLSKDDWRNMASYIQENFSVGDVVYTNPAGASLVMELYLDSSIPVQGYPPGYDILTGGWQGETLTREIAERQLTQLANNFDRIMLIEFFPAFWDPSNCLPSWLETNALLLDQRWFGNISLQLFLFE